jgi:hypothetical protein
MVDVKEVLMIRWTARIVFFAVVLMLASFPVPNSHSHSSGPYLSALNSVGVGTGWAGEEELQLLLRVHRPRLPLPERGREREVPDGLRRLHDGRLPLIATRGGSAAIAGPPLCAASLLAAVALAGCTGAPSIRYDVTIAAARPRSVQVTAVISGVNADSLVLGGFAPARALRVDALHAVDGAGRPLAVHDTPDSSRDPAPRFVVRGPLHGPLRVTWRVDPNVREGDAHVGYTGVRAGFLGETGGVVTGRGLFLVPLPASSVRDIRVAFHLPAGWQAVTPWQAEGSGWRTDLGGRFAAEHLVAATLGLGAFRERDSAWARRNSSSASPRAFPIRRSPAHCPCSRPPHARRTSCSVASSGHGIASSRAASRRMATRSTASAGPRARAARCCR